MCTEVWEYVLFLAGDFMKGSHLARGFFMPSTLPPAFIHLFGVPAFYLPALSDLGQSRCPGSGLRAPAKYFPLSLNFLFFPEMLAQAKDSRRVLDTCGQLGELGDWPHGRTASALTVGGLEQEGHESELPVDREVAHPCGWPWGSLWIVSSSFKGRG